MNRFTKVCLTFISIFFLCIISNETYAQSLLPNEGDSKEYQMTINMPKAYISGICVMANDGERVNGSIFNEFGLSMLSFSYLIEKDKVKILSAMKMINKWYIKRILRKDLLGVIKCLQNNNTTYEDTRHNINIIIKPMFD